jgi:hypothetical protein
LGEANIPKFRSQVMGYEQMKRHSWARSDSLIAKQIRL